MVCKYSERYSPPVPATIPSPARTGCNRYTPLRQRCIEFSSLPPAACPSDPGDAVSVRSRCSLTARNMTTVSGADHGGSTPRPCLYVNMSSTPSRSASTMRRVRHHVSSSMNVLSNGRNSASPCVRHPQKPSSLSSSAWRKGPESSPVVAVAALSSRSGTISLWPRRLHEGHP